MSQPDLLRIVDQLNNIKIVVAEWVESWHDGKPVYDEEYSVLVIGPKLHAWLLKATQEEIGQWARDTIPTRFPYTRVMKSRYGSIQ